MYIREEKYLGRGAASLGGKYLHPSEPSEAQRKVFDCKDTRQSHVEVLRSHYEWPPSLAFKLNSEAVYRAKSTIESSLESAQD